MSTSTPTPAEAALTCPFCNEADFDREGLRIHFERNYCAGISGPINIPITIHLDAMPDGPSDEEILKARLTPHSHITTSIVPVIRALFAIHQDKAIAAKDAEIARLKSLTTYANEVQKAEAEAEEWKSKDDMYGWNFHKGVASGLINADIIGHKENESLRARVAELVGKGVSGPVIIDGRDFPSREEGLLHLLWLLQRLSHEDGKPADGPRFREAILEARRVTKKDVGQPEPAKPVSSEVPSACIFEMTVDLEKEEVVSYGGKPVSGDAPWPVPTPITDMATVYAGSRGEEEGVVDVSTCANLERELAVANLQIASDSVCIHRYQEAGHRLEAALAEMTSSRDAAVANFTADRASNDETIKRLSIELAAAIEQRRCECSAEDACRFAQERDAAVQRAEKAEIDIEQLRAAVDMLKGNSQRHATERDAAVLARDHNRICVERLAAERDAAKALLGDAVTAIETLMSASRNECSDQFDDACALARETLTKIGEVKL